MYNGNCSQRLMKMNFGSGRSGGGVLGWDMTWCFGVRERRIVGATHDAAASKPFVRGSA